MRASTQERVQTWTDLYSPPARVVHKANCREGRDSESCKQAQASWPFLHELLRLLGLVLCRGEQRAPIRGGRRHTGEAGAPENLRQSRVTTVRQHPHVHRTGSVSLALNREHTHKTRGGSIFVCTVYRVDPWVSWGFCTFNAVTLSSRPACLPFSPFTHSSRCFCFQAE
jgi:hypothetical protein